VMLVSPSSFVPIQVAWYSPPLGSFKLNVDESSFATLGRLVEVVLCTLLMIKGWRGVFLESDSILLCQLILVTASTPWNWMP
ncbi:hypothetical protein ACH5RR_026142, partial [Cinchona calisaya]